MIDWYTLKNGNKGYWFECGDDRVYVVIDSSSGMMHMYTVKDPKATNDFDLTERRELYGQREAAAMKTVEDLRDLWTRKTGMIWDENKNDWIYGKIAEAQEKLQKIKEEWGDILLIRKLREKLNVEQTVYAFETIMNTCHHCWDDESRCQCCNDE